MIFQPEPLFKKKIVWYGQSEQIESDIKSENVGFKIVDVIKAVEFLKQELFKVWGETHNADYNSAVDCVNNAFSWLNGGGNNCTYKGKNVVVS